MSTVTLNGTTGELHRAPHLRAVRVRMTGTVFHGGGAACFLVTAHDGAPVAQFLFSLS